MLSLQLRILPLLIVIAARAVAAFDKMSFLSWWWYEDSDDRPVYEFKKVTPHLRLGRNHERVLPNILLIGAQKAGTSALGMWLHDNGICRPEVFEGEPSYFDKEVQFFDNPHRYPQGLEFYAKRFEHCRDQIFAMDATPNTLVFPENVEKIYKEAGGDHLKNLKVIVVLREPVARELSLYNHKVEKYSKNKDSNQWYSDIAKKDESIMSFHEYADVLINEIQNPQEYGNKKLWGTANEGEYALHLKKWLKFIDRENLLLIAYDEFKQNNQRVENRIRNFLGFDFPGTTMITNTRNHKRKVELPRCDTQKKLSSIFDSMNQELYSLLHANPGPAAEQQHFKRFKMTQCTNSDDVTSKPSEVVLPNLLLVGAAEAGPHTLGAWLYDAGVCHPEVFEGEPSYHDKDVEFFDQKVRFDKGLQFYAERFAHCHNKPFAMDATPNTLSFPENVEKIYKEAGEHYINNLKVIAVLREPVSGQRSLFNHKMDEFLQQAHRGHFYWDIRKQDGVGSPMSFYEYTDKIVNDIQNPGSNDRATSLASGGQYARHLKRWFDILDRNNILIISFDELQQDPQKVEQRIRDFLDFEIIGSSPSLVNNLQHRPSCRVQERLDPLFEPLNQELYKLLEQNPGPSSEQTPFPHFEKTACVDK